MDLRFKWPKNSRA